MIGMAMNDGECDEFGVCDVVMIFFNGLWVVTDGGEFDEWWGVWWINRFAMNGWWCDECLGLWLMIGFVMNDR